MALPIIATPEFKTEIPSTEQEIFFRPFLVKEEKVLLVAVESGEYSEVKNAMRKILNSCIITEGIDVYKLPSYDIEFLFLQLRARSVSDIIEFSLRHAGNNECQHVTKYELNLNDIKIEKKENHEKRIMLTDSVGVIMKEPTIEISERINELYDTNIDRIFGFVAESIEMIFDNEELYEDFTKEEVISWLEGLNKEQFEKIIRFFTTMPTLRHEIRYTCEKCGEEERIVLEGLQSFFM